MRPSRRTKIDLLKRIPLFAGCSRTELDAVSGVADELRLPAGRVLMRQGAPGRELFVLVEGEATVERDGTTIAVRRGGDFIGELALVTGRPRTATVTATTDLQTLVLDRRNFDRLLRDVPTIAAKVLKAVAERLPPETCRALASLRRRLGSSGRHRRTPARLRRPRSGVPNTGAGDRLTL